MSAAPTPGGVEALDAAFRDAVAGLPRPTGRPTTTPIADADRDDLLALFEAQATSRHLDATARGLQRERRGFYTIGSAGHEGNAMVAAATRADDPALLHYRSGAFYVARAAQVPGSTPVRDVIAGLMGSTDDPISGGRHKVFGHAGLSVLPQTSTIASHLPRAVGLAVALHRAHRLGVDCEWPDDAIVVCSFGDASANHSTAVGAINTAIHTAYQRLSVPLLLVCEDNGLGISVPTPAGWIETAYGARSGLDYVQVDGSDPVAGLPAIRDAVDRVRRERRPLFLHLRTVRFLAHAGSDAEISYRTPTQITDDYPRDPLLGTARALVAAGVASPDSVIATYDRIGAEVADQASAAFAGPLSSGPQVMAPLSPRSPDVVAAAVAAGRSTDGQVGDRGTPSTLAEAIGRTLGDALSADPRVLVFGEDVGRKGGVYGVTGGLARRFGAAQVFDTLLDEQSVLGLALGAGLAGLVPVPEIQYLAYLHNAEDQIRGEASSLAFFSDGQYRNPMVVRVPGLAYQKGFGGHFHNDNAVAVLRDIPGLVVACPARADDAAALLRTCLAAAATDGTVCVLLEPIALYHERDLHEPGDGGWLASDDGPHVPIGRARRYPAEGTTEPDLVMVTFGNGVRMSLRVRARLAERGVRADVLDLRWLAPLPVEDLMAEAGAVGRVLVVDETRHSGGVGEGVITALLEGGFSGPTARVAARDSFIPLGDAARHVLLGEEQIESAAIRLAGQERRPSLRGGENRMPPGVLRETS